MIKKLSTLSLFTMLLGFIWWLSYDLKSCKNTNSQLLEKIHSHEMKHQELESKLAEQNDKILTLSKESDRRLKDYELLKEVEENQRFRLKYLELKSNEFEDIIKILDSVKLDN